MLRESEDLPLHLGDDLALVLRSAMLQHVLYDVVAVLVLYQLVRVVVQLLEDGLGLFPGTVLQDALDHSAAVGVRRQLVDLRMRLIRNWNCEETRGTYLSPERADDELQVVGVDTFDTLLHHVVAVLILDALQHVSVQLLHNVTLQTANQIAALSHTSLVTCWSCGMHSSAF